MATLLLCNYFLALARGKKILNSIFGLVMEELNLYFISQKMIPSCHSLLAPFRGLVEVSVSS